MLLQNEICSIKITIDETYTVESADNHPFDLELNPDNYRHNDYYKALSIQIDLFSSQISIALIGDFYSYEADCAVLEQNLLTVLQNDTITQINLTDGSLLAHKKLDCFGCNFGIYKVRNGYILYGEMEITMLDFQLNKLWTFSGKDILVSMGNEKSFELCENSIKLTDFEENEYEIDFDGNLIE